MTTPTRVTALLAFVCCLWTADAARACSCAVMAAPQARDAAVLVFEGELLRITASSDGPGAAIAVFRLSRVWKGTPPRELSVQIPAPPTMCPPHFEVGQRYIVYASGTAAAPRVTRCARYAWPAQIEAERSALGPPLRTFR